MKHSIAAKLILVAMFIIFQNAVSLYFHMQLLNYY